MNDRTAVSIVVPTLNEADNIGPLVQRINNSLAPAGIPYEVLVIDDHSTDATAAAAHELSKIYPVRFSLKSGKRGKAYSLLQGFAETRHPLVAMIDADLQYPPEEIINMYHLMEFTEADVITTRRAENETSAIRKLSSKVFNFFFARLLFGIDFDTQSGLKLFKKHILTKFDMTPSPWSFDLEFLVRSLENKFKIVSHTIPFAERTAGITKVKILNVTLELARASLQLRWRTSAPKIRAGYRDNSVFLKRAFPAAVVTLVCAFSLLGGQGHTSALSLPTNDDLTQPIAAQLTDASNLLPVSGGNPAGITPSNPAAASSLPVANSGSGGSQTGQSQTPAGGMASPNNSDTSSAANQSGSNPDSSITLASHRTGTAAISLPPVDNSKLAAATNTNDKSGIYASGYPYYRLSNVSQHKLNVAAGSALLIGSLCIAAVILVSSIKLKTSYRYAHVSRS